MYTQFQFSKMAEGMGIRVYYYFSVVHSTGTKIKIAYLEGRFQHDFSGIKRKVIENGCL